MVLRERRGGNVQVATVLICPTRGSGQRKNEAVIPGRFVSVLVDPRGKSKKTMYCTRPGEGSRLTQLLLWV